MEIKGKIKHVSEVVEGEGKNGAWAKRTIVITEDVAEHPNELVLSMFKSGEHIDYAKDKFSYAIGDLVSIEYNTRANEYQGKWYGDNSIWKIEKVSGEAVAQTQKQEPSDDLPF